MNKAMNNDIRARRECCGNGTEERKQRGQTTLRF